jgi:hypothetical protein
MMIAGSSDRTVPVHFCEYYGRNIIIASTFSRIQYSYLKNQPIGPEIMCHLAGIAMKISLHCHNHILYCLIIPYNLLISRS